MRLLYRSTAKHKIMMVNFEINPTEHYHDNIQYLKDKSERVSRITFIAEKCE